MQKIFHSVLGKFIDYTDEQIDYLKGGGDIKFMAGATMYTLRLTEQGNGLAVHSIAHVPVELEEDIPEIEADEPDSSVVEIEDDTWDDWDD